MAVDAPRDDSRSRSRSPAPPAEASRSRRAFDDAVLRRKVSWLIAATAMWGAAAGYAAGAFGWGPAGVLLGGGAIALAAALAGRRWVAAPIEELVIALSRIAGPDRPLSPRHLPRHRRDEVGQLARAMHQIATSAIRDHTEARQLRRTLDHRIETATRKATAQLRHMAMRDEMTNLANRRFLDQNLDELVNSCRDTNTDLLCIALDVDHFKRVNDTLGHAAGDELIKFTGKLIAALIRSDDFAARLGGDEFLVFMPGADLDRARQFIHTAQHLYAEHVMLHLPEDLDVALSIGVASLSRDGAADGADLMQRADENLYLAKQAGKGMAMGG